MGRGETGKEGMAFGVGVECDCLFDDGDWSSLDKARSFDGESNH